MIKAIVFDKDGTMMSAKSYLNPFVEHLGTYVDPVRIKEAYALIKTTAELGKAYDPVTLQEAPGGKTIKNAFWLPLLAALHAGFKGNLQAVFDDFSDRYISHHIDRTDLVDLTELLVAPHYRKAVVSSDCNSEQVLKQMGIYDSFDLRCFGVNKEKNIDALCSKVQDSFDATPSDIVWVEDDLSIAGKLHQRGFRLVLRKTEGLLYPSDEELQRIACLVLPDTLHPLILYVRAERG